MKPFLRKSIRNLYYALLWLGALLLGLFAVAIGLLANLLVWLGETAGKASLLGVAAGKILMRYMKRFKSNPEYGVPRTFIYYCRQTGKPYYTRDGKPLFVCDPETARSVLQGDGVNSDGIPMTSQYFGIAELDPDNRALYLEGDPRLNIGRKLKGKALPIPGTEQ